MKVNLSMDDIRTKVEEYIKKAGRATGRPVLTAYYVMTADTTPDNERTNIMLALVAIVFPTMFEFKLNDSAEAALRQIDEKGYLLPYQADGRKVVKVGVAFEKEERNIGEWVIGE